MRHLATEQERDETAAEYRLWRAIIAQAIDDATRMANSFDPADREDARQWLTTPSADLEAVCSLADINPECLIRFAKAKIAEADSKPRKHRQPANTKLITFNGVTLSLTDWAARIGLTAQALSIRLRHMSIEEALTKRPHARPGGGSQLDAAAQGPAPLHSARSAENRDSEKEAA